MLWRIPGFSTTSPVDSILDKENFTLEDLLDEDEIIQECKALNTRLICFLREKAQVEQLLHYIVEEAPEGAEKKRIFKFPFIACEIFTCEIDIILRTLVDEEELMDLLFSFVKPDHPHSTSLAGYFSKVVICLMLRKAPPLMKYIQAHQEIFHQLVDLMGITSIMEVLIRLIGADENMYSNHADAVQWLENTDVLEMIVDKFGSSDSPEVHANAAEILCAITRYAPPRLAAKICSPSFVERLFHHALESSRPKSVLIHTLSLLISLLDPKRLFSASNHLFGSQQSHGSLVTATSEAVDVMLERLGDLLKLLDVSSTEITMLTTYGMLQPPLGKHRLKIVEFISVLLTVGSEAAEKELVQLGALRCVFDLFLEYPFNNFLHHHVENIIICCLESKGNLLTEHLLKECDIVGKILAADMNPTLSVDSVKPTVSAEGRTPPRIGNIGHITRIANKLIQLGNNSSIIQTHLQENAEWDDWHTNILLKRNTLENVYQWTCGRPTSLHDRGRDSDDDDFRDRDYDVAALANNLSQAFRYGIYSNDDIEEAPGSLERDDEDVYFDDESAEVVISSLRLRDDQESDSLFKNTNWFAFEDDRTVDEHSADSLMSPSSDKTDVVICGEGDDVTDISTSPKPSDVPAVSEEPGYQMLENSPNGVLEDKTELPNCLNEVEKPAEWVEWRETSDVGELSDVNAASGVSNGELEPEEDTQVANGFGSDLSKHEDEGGSPASRTVMENLLGSNCNACDAHESVEIVQNNGTSDPVDVEATETQAAVKAGEDWNAAENTGN